MRLRGVCLTVKCVLNLRRPLPLYIHEYVFSRVLVDSGTAQLIDPTNRTWKFRVELTIFGGISLEKTHFLKIRILIFSEENFYWQKQVRIVRTLYPDTVLLN